MIIQKGEQAEVLSNFDTDSINMTIDDSDKQVLMHILSTGLYQDPIGSLIRENVSNNLDATVEAGSTKPVIVGLTQDESYQWYFYSQDFGTGISPERMEKIVSKYAASTKRGDSTQKGYFGLGLKSGLAYADSFWIITNFDSTKYSYLMYKGDEGSKIELMDSQPTEDENGTMFKVYLKTGHYEKETFLSKIKEQLRYVENLYFDIPNFDNNYKIYKADNWWYVPNHTDKSLHIVLDGIYYPLDFNKLGIGRIDIPIALKFDLSDSLVPVPSRESIIMNPATKQKILDKIAKVKEDLINRYNESCSSVDDWREYERLHRVTSYYVKVDDTALNISGIADKSTLKKPDFTGFEFNLLKAEDFIGKIPTMLEYYTSSYKINNGILTSSNLYLDMFDTVIRQHESYRNLIIKGDIDRWKVDYLKATNEKTVVIYRKTGSRQLNYAKSYSAKTCYISLLKLTRIPKNQWREIIKEYQAFESWIINNCFESFDEINVPQVWIDNEKEARKALWKTRKVKESGTFVLKHVEYSDRSNWGGTTTSMTYDDNTVRQLTGLLVYTVEDEKGKLGRLSSILRSDRIRPVIVAKSHLKRLEGLNNFISYEEFMKGNNRPFKVYATAILIAKETTDTQIGQYDFIEKVKLIDPSYSQLCGKMKQYANLIHSYRANEKFMEAVLYHAKENNLFDPVMMQELQEFQRKYDDFSFMKHMNFQMRGGVPDKEALRFATEYVKYRRLYKRDLTKRLQGNCLETEVKVAPSLQISRETKELTLNIN